MAELSDTQRLDWLAAIAAKVKAGAQKADPIALQELGEVARGCRLRMVDSIDRQLGPFDEHHLQALLEVPRERFVRHEDIERSADDVPLPLDADGLATISAPHAYALTYRLLGLARGDSLVELGTGSGYGAALAAFVVGPEGKVITFEIDPALAAWARTSLSASLNIVVVDGDAMTSAPAWRHAPKVAVTFAIDAIPDNWLDSLPDGGRLVAPVGPREGDQRLMLALKRHGRVQQSDHGAVRYVRNRSAR
jgi:protein-L-isoaspartate(D-aspartate) O-methyltransferase